MTQGVRPKSVLGPDFGEWLRRSRTNKGMSMTDFAKATNMHVSSISSLENGKRPGARGISIGVFERIAEALDLEFGYVLHKAGFDIGAGGIKIARLKRIEAVAEAFAHQESDMRSAIAEAMAGLGVANELNNGDAEDLIDGLGRALGALDLVTERLREEGLQGDTFRSMTFTRGKPRPWTDSELRFLSSNPNLSNDEVGRQLNRSVDAIRSKRGQLQREEA